MMSAFGVDHGDISKSFVPKGPGQIPKTGDWIKASKLNAKQRNQVKIYNQAKKRKRLGLDQYGRPVRQRIQKAQVKPGVFKPITELGNIERAKVTNRLRGGYKEGYGFAQNPTDATGRKIWGPHRPDTPQGRSVRADMKAPELKSAGVSIAHAQPNGRGGGLIVMSPEAKNRPDVIRHELQHLAPRRNPWNFGNRLRDPVRRGREEGRADFLANGKATPGAYPGNHNFNLGYNEVQSKMTAGRQRRVSKSLINGAFKPISQIPKAERSAVGGYKAARGMSPDHAAWIKERKEEHMPFYAHALEQNGGKSKVRNDPFSASAFTFRIGGKSSGSSYVVGGAPKGKPRKYIAAHEAQHANPKRSSYRLHYQIGKNPKKLMREEGRADYLAGGHFSQHPDGLSMYAQGARALDGVKTRGPKKPFKFQPDTKKAFKDMGIAEPRIRNSEALSNVKAAIQTQFPQYPLHGKKGDRALNAYRKLHNDMAARGVPGGGRRKR